MKKLFLLLALLLSPSVYAMTGENLSLKEQIQQELQKQGLIWALWSTIDEAWTIETGAVGIKNGATGEPLISTNTFHAGSIAKPMISLTILHLATIGKISLDDPIEKYTPDIHINNPWRESHPITIRHLLDHTAGFHDLRLWHVFSTDSAPDGRLELAFERSTDVLSVRAKPGSTYSYSNMGYTLLGLIIERVTKTRYEKYIQENLFVPLGMKSTTLFFTTQTWANVDTNIALGHNEGNSPSAALPMYMRPAWQIQTSTYDMGLLMQFLLRWDWKIGTQEFIKKEFMETLWKPTTTDAFRNGVITGYGLGFGTREKNGSKFILHGWDTLGFRAMMQVFPEAKKWFFIVVNMDDETAKYDGFYSIMTRCIWVRQDAEIVQKPISPEENLKNWNGYYIRLFTKVEPFWITEYLWNFTKFSLNATWALLEPYGWVTKNLTYFGNSLFVEKDRHTPSHTLYTNESWELLISDGLRTLKKVSLLSIVAVCGISLFGWVSLLWIFFLWLIRYIRTKTLKHAITPVWLSIFLLIVAVPFLWTQGFMSLGDMSTGNILLALATWLIPIWALVSLVITLRNSRETAFWKTETYALISIILMSATYLAFWAFPLILWI